MRLTKEERLEKREEGNEERLREEGERKRKKEREQ